MLKSARSSKPLSISIIYFLLFQLAAGVFLFVPLPKQAQAVTQNWSLTSASNYTFDDTKIGISSGQAQLKATSNWYDTDWGYRKAITIDNTSNANDLTNYQVQISLNSSNFDFLKAQSDGDDLRFTDNDGTTLIDYWIEDFSNASSSATIWTEVPSISASSTETIYMYYGNSEASSASNGNNTFEFFDSFESGSPYPYPLMFDLFKGKPWERYAGNPILEKSASGWDSYGIRDVMLMVDANDNLVREDDEYIMYYRGNEYDASFSRSPDHIKRQIGKATSPDGINWTKDTVNNPVLELGESGQWDDQEIGSAWVIKLGANDYVMYYDGYKGSASGIGKATSSDGISWTKWDCCVLVN